MKRPLPISPPFRVLALGLPLALLLSGCYSDPNISEGKRYAFPPPDETPTVGGTAQPGIAPPGIVPPGQPAPGPSSPGQSFPSSDATGTKLAVGDSLVISFSDVPLGALPAQMTIKVGSEGTITLPHNIVVFALGKTPTELERDIRNAYVPALYVQCTASVKAEDRYFFVGGEVKISNRQIYTSQSMTVLRAITTAGGFTDFAKKTKIEVRRANGKTEYVNYYKALKDPKLDLPVFPNDQVIVPRGI
jgi:polysaccharide export outer membrane protein